MKKLQIAWAVEFDCVHVIAITPCCGKIVRHGSCEGKDWEGSRAPHCDCGNGEYHLKKGQYTKKVNEVK